LEVGFTVKNVNGKTINYALIYPLTTGVGEIIDGIFKEENYQSIAPGESGTFTASYILASEDYSNQLFNLNAYNPGNRYVQ